MRRAFFIFAVLALTVPCSADIIYVDDDAPPDGNGTTWETAYKYLQDALTAAEYGDETWVAQGTYTTDANSLVPDGSGDRKATFRLISGVALYGGFAGGETGLEQRNWQANETILSGDLNGDDVGGPDDASRNENSYHVVMDSGTDASAVLNGFTITGGNADSSGSNGDGGGMYNDSGSATLSNCTFIGNSAKYDGGGIYGDHGSETFADCTFRANVAGDNGGAIYVNSDGGTLTNCAFVENFATDDGGGLYNYSGSQILTNCSFIGNTANDDGGGICNAINSNPTLINCVFSGNSVGRRGGGMYTYFYSYPTLINCTFSANHSDNNGGGMYSRHESDPTLTNCILWGNTDDAGSDESAQIYIDSSTPVVTFSCIQGLDTFAGSGNIGDDPLFADADGADDIVGTEDDNARLSAGSPCIDAGDNTEVPGGVTTDLDGRERFMDDTETVDTGTGTPPIVDMGAYEYTAVCGDADHPYPTGDLNSDCEVNMIDLAMLSEHWMECTKPQCN